MNIEVSEVINYVFSGAVVLVFIVLIWFIVELVFTVRRARAIVVDTKEKLDPTLEHVENITASLEPVVAKIDPLVDRVSLTIDAANLEIMRLDQILEDVTEITETVSSAANAVDVAANAPLELVNNVTSRIRNAFKSNQASDQSVLLGDRRMSDVAEDAVRGVQDAVEEQSQARHERRATTQAAEQVRQANIATVNQAADQMGSAVESAINYDTEKIQNRYFTYSSAGGQGTDRAQTRDGHE